MKTSNRILLSCLVAILVIIIGLVASARVLLNRVAEQVREIELSGEMIDREYRFDAFRSVRMEGAWTVTITEGREYTVSVHGDSAAVDHVTVDVRGDELVLSTGQDVTIIGENIEVYITMPTLIELHIRGGADTFIRGFNQERIHLHIDGATRVRADGLHVGELTIDSRGAANIEFGDVAVHTAQVNLDGASNVHLHMTGGPLSGRVKGVGVLRYSGTVESESVTFDGLGFVEHTGVESP